MIKTGIQIIPTMPVTEVIELALEAEKLGYDYCLIADERFSDPTPATESTPEEETTSDYVMSLRVSYHPDREAP